MYKGVQYNTSQAFASAQYTQLDLKQFHASFVMLLRKRRAFCYYNIIETAIISTECGRYCPYIYQFQFTDWPYNAASKLATRVDNIVPGRVAETIDGTTSGNYNYSAEPVCGGLVSCAQIARYQSLSRY